MTCLILHRNTKEQPDAWRHEPEAWRLADRVQRLDKCASAMDALGYVSVDERGLGDSYVDVVLYKSNGSSKIWD